MIEAEQSGVLSGQIAPSLAHGIPGGRTLGVAIQPIAQESQEGASHPFPGCVLLAMDVKSRQALSVCAALSLLWLCSSAAPFPFP